MLALKKVDMHSHVNGKKEIKEKIYTAYWTDSIPLQQPRILDLQEEHCLMSGLFGR